MQAALGALLTMLATQAAQPQHAAPAAPEWMTVKEYAAWIKVSPRAVYDMIREGLPHYRPRERLVRIKVAEADRWVASSIGEVPDS